MTTCLVIGTFELIPWLLSTIKAFCLLQVCAKNEKTRVQKNIATAVDLAWRRVELQQRQIDLKKQCPSVFKVRECEATEGNYYPPQK